MIVFFYNKQRLWPLLFLLILPACIFDNSREAVINCTSSTVIVRLHYLNSPAREFNLTYDRLTFLSVKKQKELPSNVAVVNDAKLIGEYSPGLNSRPLMMLIIYDEGMYAAPYKKLEQLYTAKRRKGWPTRVENEGWSRFLNFYKEEIKPFSKACSRTH